MKQLKVERIKKEEVKSIINEIPFTAFWGCTFRKADGSIRRMNCNKSISKGLKNPRQPKVLTTDKNFINVYDVNAANGKGGYRMVNISTIADIRSNGKLYIVV